MYINATKPSGTQRQLEARFSQMENDVSQIYRRVIKAHDRKNSEIVLNRTDKDFVRKFLFLLKYRGQQFHQKFNHDNLKSYEGYDKELLQEYMRRHNFKQPLEVWLHNLETIMDLEMDAEKEWIESLGQKMFPPDAEWFIDSMGSMYLAICTPKNRDERFILTDNAYNVYEGPTTHFEDEKTGKQATLAPYFHEFSPISPNLMLVLRYQYLPEPNEDTNPEIMRHRKFERNLWIDSRFGPGTKSILEDLPAEPRQPRQKIQNRPF
ncbi:hypothetical protein G7Z17_g573 [Cylindrodendrum hubeiense]|uniref:Uncharacterized protein n=1 Tax=Cylindrodendrum hubeiense TaxID=595255 RepID=A0A9P5LM76_9HYPO|nr:hypothetical protein G7Z17_g573 [Cylindrodendrum hubeiense]